MVLYRGSVILLSYSTATWLAHTRHATPRVPVPVPVPCQDPTVPRPRLASTNMRESSRRDDAFENAEGAPNEIVSLHAAILHPGEKSTMPACVQAMLRP